ncbi:hypothetical protein LOZ66_006749 [Ophidiomyces ophidiicola]|nr:hypothetical protein LOZ66_006749 [Ophidiomyces ophidiicola]
MANGQASFTPPPNAPVVSMASGETAPHRTPGRTMATMGLPDLVRIQTFLQVVKGALLHPTDDIISAIQGESRELFSNNGVAQLKLDYKPEEIAHLFNDWNRLQTDFDAQQPHIYSDFMGSVITDIRYGFQEAAARCLRVTWENMEFPDPNDAVPGLLESLGNATKGPISSFFEEMFGMAVRMMEKLGGNTVTATSKMIPLKKLVSAMNGQYPPVQVPMYFEVGTAECELNLYHM